MREGETLGVNVGLIDTVGSNDGADVGSKVVGNAEIIGALEGYLALNTGRIKIFINKTKNTQITLTVINNCIY